MVFPKRNILTGCLITILLVGAAHLIRGDFLMVVEKRNPFVTFYPAVIIASLIGGVIPGILATFLASCLAAFFWIEPVGFHIGAPDDQLGLLMFIISSGMVIAIIEVMHRLHQRHAEMAMEVRLADVREEAAEMVRKERSLLRQVIDNSSNIIFVRDRSGLFLLANQATAAFFGKTAEEMTDLSTADFAFGNRTEHIQKLRKAYQKVVETGGRVEEYVEMIGADGMPHWFKAVLTPLFPGEARPDQLLCVAADITDLKVALDRLEKSEEQIHDLTMHLESVREAERLAISREIHDTIGQFLSALKLDLSFIEHRFQPWTSELTSRINEMRSGIDRHIVVVRQMVAELRPPLLDNLGLAAAVEWQAREFMRRTGIEVHLLLNEETVEINQDTATAVMRIILEALTNISRHAEATEASISLCRDPQDSLIVEVSDNGRGITGDEIDAPHAYGLMGMRERARLCQGVLSVKGKPGAGTTVRLVIPAAEARRHHADSHCR